MKKLSGIERPPGSADVNTAKFFIVSKCVQLLGKKLRLYEMGNASRSGK